MEGFETEATFWLDDYRKYHGDVIVSHLSKTYLRGYFNFIEHQKDLTPELCGKLCVTSKNFYLNFTDNFVIGVNDFLVREISDSNYRYLEIRPKHFESISIHFIIDVCMVLIAILIYNCSVCFGKYKKAYTIKESDTLEQCSICLEQFKLFEKVERTPCKHLFHFDCIEEWNLINKFCPLCKHEIKIF